MFNFFFSPLQSLYSTLDLLYYYSSSLIVTYLSCYAIRLGYQSEQYLLYFISTFITWLLLVIIALRNIFFFGNITFAKIYWVLYLVNSIYLTDLRNKHPSKYRRVKLKWIQNSNLFRRESRKSISLIGLFTISILVNIQIGVFQSALHWTRAGYKQLHRVRSGTWLF